MAAGVLIRRTVPAMAVTLAIFAAVQVIWPQFVRPYLITPVTANHPFNPALIDRLEMGGPGGHTTVFSGVNLPGAWVVTNNVTAASGQPSLVPRRRLAGTVHSRRAAALGRLHLRQVVTYQPASRYWAFQWYETGIFLFLALALAGFCFWWVRRRLA